MGSAPAFAALLTAAVGGCVGDAVSVFRISTTTSLDNSGLLDEILPVFEVRSTSHVRVRALGTGQALEDARRGNADLLLAHAPALEARFVAEGFGTARYPFAYNYFVLVGPRDDPAGVAGKNVTESFHRIYANRSTFTSRGDESGTHARERTLWELAGFDYAGDVSSASSHWYKSLGQGMGQTLLASSELGAYTLADEGTFFSFRSRLDLVIWVDRDPPLLNQYSAIPVDGSKVAGVNERHATAFAEWITGEEGQARVGAFRVGDHVLFTPNAGGQG